MEKRHVHILLVKNTDGKRLLGRCKCRLEENVKIKIGEI
jgi:hypothetical protein